MEAVFFFCSTSLVVGDDPEAKLALSEMLPMCLSSEIRRSCRCLTKSPAANGTPANGKKALVPLA